MAVLFINKEVIKVKRRTEISNRSRYISDNASTLSKYNDRSDFYKRWYDKFGEPQTRTMRADEFMKRLKEMIDFE